MTSGRLTAVALLVTGLVTGPALTAGAQTLSDHLERGAGAGFSGSQAVRCATPDGDREVIVDIVQADGVFSTVAAPGDGGSVQVTAGALAVVRPDGSRSSTAVQVSERLAAGNYSIVESDLSRLAGRDVTELTVADRSETERAVLSFDVGTGALLSSRILHADGSTYCETQMIAFDASPSDPGAVPTVDDPLESVDSHPRLPESVAGFDRLDLYRWDEDGVIGFYSDGLFSFSLLATTRSVELAATDVTEVEAGDGSYMRWFGPGQVVMAWDETGGGLALSGDLPPDMLDAVLVDLPEPAPRGLLSRMWRNLFG